MPATKKPTVQLCVNHLTSFIAIGLRSGDKDRTSPSKKNNKLIQLISYISVTSSYSTYRITNQNLLLQFANSNHRCSNPNVARAAILGFCLLFYTKIHLSILGTNKYFHSVNPLQSYRQLEHKVKC